MAGICKDAKQMAATARLHHGFFQIRAPELLVQSGAVGRGWIGLLESVGVGMEGWTRVRCVVQQEEGVVV